MSDERLARIEAKIDRVIEIQGNHTTILAEHSSILAEHTATLAEHSSILAEHTTTLEDHTRRLDRLEIGHEVLRDSVAQIAEGHAAILCRLDRGIESIRVELDERLTPVVEAVRRLSAR